jgi:hypothetical protein
LACLAITILFMCATIIRMFEGVRPFDWLMFGIEVAVVALILCEIIADTRRRRAETKHKLLVDTQALELSMLLTQGERLQLSVPNELLITDQRVVPAWIKDVQGWIEGTKVLLSVRSPKASADFMLIADIERVSVYVGSPNGFYVRGESATWYRNLVIHLENLRRITSRSEAYF